jgi:hypothetical protein
MLYPLLKALISRIPNTVFVFIIPFCAGLSLYNLTAAAGLTWQFGGEDGGDLAVALKLNGIPHPTGYPLYLISSKIFLLFTPDSARALNIASTVWGSLAAGFFSLSIFKFAPLFKPFSRHSGQNPLPVWVSVAVAILSGLGLAVTPLVWSQAIIAEVYSFNVLITALALLILATWLTAPQKQRFRYMGLLALVAGVLAGHHRTGIFSVGAIGLFLGLRNFSTLFKQFKLKYILLPALFLVGMLAPYIYNLVRGGVEPASNWSDITDFASFLSHFSGEQYNQLLFSLPLNQTFSRSLDIFAFLGEQLGITGLLTGIPGLILLLFSKANRPLFWLIAIGSSLPLGFIVIYPAENAEVYLLPFLLFWGIGGAGFLIKTSFLFNKLIFALVCLVLLAQIIFSLIFNYTRFDLSNNREAAEWVERQLARTEPQAILVSRQDATTFALWYGQYSQNLRRDVVIVELRLLDKLWYRNNLQRLYPDLQLPQPNCNLSDLLCLARMQNQITTLNPKRTLQGVGGKPGKTDSRFYSTNV